MQLITQNVLLRPIYYMIGCKHKVKKYPVDSAMIFSCLKENLLNTVEFRVK